MAVVTICSDFGTQENKYLTVSIISISICHEMMGTDDMIFILWMLSFKPTFSLSSFTFIKRHFSSSLFAIRVVSFAYLRLLIFSWQSWFQLVCFIHPDIFWDIQIYWNISLHINKISTVTIYSLDILLSRFGIVCCSIQTVASWPTYRFLRRQVRWSGISIPWRVFHSLLWFTQAKALV